MRKRKDGGACGYCHQQGRQRANYNGHSLEEALEHSWSAKTDDAARSVPFDFDPRATLVVERFFDQYDSWPASRQAINRRVKRAAETAPELEASEIYPHCLRATAASYHAGRGLDVLPLQALMGGRIRIRRKGISKSPERTRLARSI